MAGSLDEIIKAFLSLFKGREDIFAARWEKDGRSGYMPAYDLNWDEFSKFKGLVFYFINPFSNLDKKWVVQPYVHAQIADNASLKTGLKSMFETVDLLNEEEINEKFK